MRSVGGPTVPSSGAGVAAALPRPGVPDAGPAPAPPPPGPAGPPGRRAARADGFAPSLNTNTHRRRGRWKGGGLALAKPLTLALSPGTTRNCIHAVPAFQQNESLCPVGSAGGNNPRRGADTPRVRDGPFGGPPGPSVLKGAGEGEVCPSPTPNYAHVRPLGGTHRHTPSALVPQSMS